MCSNSVDEMFGLVLEGLVEPPDLFLPAPSTDMIKDERALGARILARSDGVHLEAPQAQSHGVFSAPKTGAGAISG